MVEKKTKPGIAASAMMLLIRGYQLTLSAFFGRTCRHLPTCSSYTMEAIGRHGAWAGFWLGLFRIARCNPWGSSGFDPVPGSDRGTSNDAAAPLAGLPDDTAGRAANQ